MTALEISGLTLRIGDSEILRGVDLQLEAGRIQGLAGESGSGKTMTGLAVMGLLPARGGGGGGGRGWGGGGGGGVGGGGGGGGGGKVGE
jgi:ABC-type glutathione transport system ATPase component